MVVTLGQQYNIGEKLTVRHAAHLHYYSPCRDMTPNITKGKRHDELGLHLDFVTLIVSRIAWVSMNEIFKLFGVGLKYNW